PSAAVGAGEDAEGRARRRGTTARALARELRGDLDAIVLTAMRKEPERRYASVERLADDLARFLAGRPVAAKGESFSYRARKLAARHRFATGALLLALFVLVSAAIAVGISARTAKARLVEVQRLSDLRQLTDLRARAEELWPARPTQLPGMQAWLEAARTLHDRGTDHASALERLRARALPYDAQQRELDRAGHPRRSELDAARVRLASLRWRLEHESGDVRALPERIATLEREIGELEHAVLERRTWAFTDPADRWEHDELVQLLDELAGFAAPKSGAIDRMRSRAELAEALEKDLGDTHAEAWRAAIATIGDPARAPHYGGLVLTPQIGLAPLGPDPESGLWEFAELSTGRPPERGADGRLAIGEETALVLVLLPGGRARIGSAAPGTGDDPDDEDRLTRADEQPPNAVELAPFFLSKYEMTQGQWLRFSGSNPSAIAPGQQHGDHTTGLGHPVEHMSWEEADTMLWRMGLVLPTEAQWEYAARAGTRTAWWTGDDRDALEGAANIADAAARRVGAPWPAIREWPEHDDGHVVHASVGTYRPNPFGLHDTAGNVWEWCLDEYALYDLPTEPRTGLRQWKGGREHCGRGGSYMEGAASTRSAHRGHAVLGAREASIGVRPARVVE
ncbi:MAG: SUMF1/EgtB/PvdO family nonheme iron enzyme, partial [Planctomycetes bacterium]|nr:SUMF1/EgtB/PvdO family nonheme iron enzyme [Planctomycetota bacterium]